MVEFANKKDTLEPKLVRSFGLIGVPSVVSEDQ